MTGDAPPLRWGIVGTGQIARVFATSITSTEVGVVGGVLSRTRDRGEEFASSFGAQAVTAIDDLLCLELIDAVYIASPHPAHHEAAMAAIDQHIPVLCEKPMTCSPEETRQIVETARLGGVPLIEAWMYRCHPQIPRLVSLIQDGLIGRVKRIDSWFGFHSSVDHRHRLRNTDLGGGAILDIGGYPMSAAMLVAGVANGVLFSKPSLDSISGSIGETGVDEDATAHLHFDGGIEATVRASITEDLGMSLQISGTEGVIVAQTPFLPESRREGLSATIAITTGESATQETLTSPVDCFALEATVMSELIARGACEPPAPMVRHDESVAIAQALMIWQQGLTRSGVPAS